MEKQVPDESPRVEALRQRALEVRAIAVKGLVELDQLEAELKELRKLEKGV